MKRREFIALLGGAAAMGLLQDTVLAQSSSKRPLIACVFGGSQVGADKYFSAFKQGLSELGYVEGRDYDFEVRYADGDSAVSHRCWRNCYGTSQT